MQHIGIDLAWGERQPTGLAVLDDEGALVHVSAVRTDDEIAERLAAYVEGSCLVAVDAPLVVRNETGSRPAEKALTRDFRRFEAGCHPSNLSKPEFRDGPRAARVCKRLGLDVDPRSGRARRAIEVYPHPATVVLFGLERTLKYKDKRGRDVDLLRSELLRLMTHVEGLVRTDEAWAALRRAVETATRKSQLRVVEDQVDAVVCAYVGLFADRFPDRTTVYGDLAEGYIVTPALPDDSAAIRAAIQAYAAQHGELSAAGEQAAALVTSILDEAGINYLTVTGRTKSVASFAEKAGRTRDGQPLYPSPLTDITDQLGVRVITYVQDDVEAVAGLLADQVVVHDDRDMGQQTASEGRWGYASRHLLVALDAARESQPAYAGLRGRVAQVQVRTVLQHAWAEFEHDIRYKGNVPDDAAADLDRRFTLAAGLIELADREFATIRERIQAAAPGSPAEPEADHIVGQELATFLAGHYSDAGWSHTDHYDWIAGLLAQLGIDSVDDLADLLTSVDADAVIRRMGYRYPAGAVRRLDDALLAIFGEQYVALEGNSHRVPLLRARLEKLTTPESRETR